MDANQINQTYDLLSMAISDTALKKCGSYQVGPCPFCGGRDRFLIKHTQNGYRWYCRKCGNGKYHTALDYIMQRGNVDFKTALRQLDDSDKIDLIMQTTILPMPASLALPDRKWQVNALNQMEAASDRLLTGKGSEGRDYLARRGFHRGTWNAWHLGLCL